MICSLFFMWKPITSRLVWTCNGGWLRTHQCSTLPNHSGGCESWDDGHKPPLPLNPFNPCICGFNLQLFSSLITLTQGKLHKSVRKEAAFVILWRQTHCRCSCSLKQSVTAGEQRPEDFQQRGASPEAADRYLCVLGAGWTAGPSSGIFWSLSEHRLWDAGCWVEALSWRFKTSIIHFNESEEKCSKVTIF